MSIIVDENDYRTGYPILVGGVLKFGLDHFVKVNGYSNMFWGWGKYLLLLFKVLKFLCIENYFKKTNI